MLELLVVFGLIALAVAVAVAALKVLLWLVFLPLKIGIWAVKGVVLFVVLIPAAIIALCALSVVGPIALVVFSVAAVPLALAAAGIAWLISVLC